MLEIAKRAMVKFKTPTKQREVNTFLTVDEVTIRYLLIPV